MTEIVATEPRERKSLAFSTVQISQVGGGGMLLPTTFGEVVAFAEVMARSKHAIPKHLRENPGACLAVTMQALRWEMDPFAVAAKAYSVNDMIAYEAQLIAAVVHTRAPIRRRPDYVFTGSGQDLRCSISCEMLDGSVKVYESPRVGDITTKNSPLWKTDPQQQLGYYSIRAWARRYTPEVLLGVYSPDEAEEFRGDRARDVTPRSSMADRLSGNTPTGGFSSADVEGAVRSTSQPFATAPANEGGKNVDPPQPEPQTQDQPESREESETVASEATPTIGETAATDSDQVEVDAVPGDATAGKEERSAAPHAGLSSDDRETLRFYAEELDAERAPFAIDEVKRRYWLGKKLDGQAAIAIAAGKITAAHLDRVNGKLSMDECTRACRAALQ